MGTEQTLILPNLRDSLYIRRMDYKDHFEHMNL